MKLLSCVLLSIAITCIVASAAEDETDKEIVGVLQQALQQDADTEDGVMQEEVLARISAATCADYCRSADKRDGVIIGIAPICDGRCGRDCPGRFCTIGSRFWHDYGHPCWWGNKICCCAVSKD